jgi:hypothetical protein
MRLGALVAALLLAWAAPASAEEWLAGDLHVHTTYSHDSYGGPGDDNTGPEEAYTLGFPVAGQFALAASRGLDFLAITDHDDVRSQADPGFGSSGVIGLPGYENSLQGHAQMLGATRLYDSGDESAAAVNAMAAQLRSDGGVFQVNHPASESTAFPDDIDWSYGHEVRPDTVEVWNIGPRAYQPPGPSANSNDDAIRWWQGWLDRGERVAATGGSDSHWVSVSALAGVGQPTTWVLAAERSQAAILAALRAGRTTISAQPPALGGTRVFLEGGPGWRATVGDAVRARSHLRVRVHNGTGALLRVVVSGGREPFAAVPITASSWEHRFRLPSDARWAYAEVLDFDAAEARRSGCDPLAGSVTTLCRNSLSVRAMTSAIHVDG